MPECIVNDIKNAKTIGEKQYHDYVKERLEKCTTPVSETIKRNSLCLFGMSEKKKGKARSKLTSLRNDCNLFSRLYISCQSRDGNLQEFFRHENSSCPPSLSCEGKLRVGQKSDLVECLEVSSRVERPSVDVKIIDAAVLVNRLKPGKCKTFDEYARNLFTPYIVNQAQHVKRIDLVWDRYLDTSLKRNTREARGQGIRRRVCSKTPVPKNWQSFLRSDQNKSELFCFLAECISSLDLPGVQIITTNGASVSSSQPIERIESLAPCNHEEADTRLLVHTQHSAIQGYKKIMIRTVDTDIVVLAVANFHKLNADELWIAFGVGKHLKYLPAHSMAGNLSIEECEALPFFHALTGCDTVSYLSGIGKKTAWSAWKAFKQVTPTLRTLSMPRDEPISKDDMDMLEGFVVVMYTRTCPLKHVNEARQSLFSQGAKRIENIPPTQAALLQHINRAVYQAGHVWGQTLVPIQELPSPYEWGWLQSEDGWVPFWSDLPEASKACAELIKCGCKKSCRGNCKCTKAELPCTALCACTGSCFQD